MTDEHPLVKEKHDILRRLSEKNYDSEIKKEKDELRLGQLNLEISEELKLKLHKVKIETPKRFEELKITTVKQARMLRKQKRDIYKDSAKECLDLYYLFVEKKKDGTTLENKLKDKNLDKYDLNKTISEVREY